MLTCPQLSEIPHLRHGFFGREGGVSDGLYASLNCGYGSGDDLEKVTENRKRVSEALGSDAPLLTAFQIHSAKVVTVNAAWEWKNSPEADALVTDQPNIPLGILTADCLPVLFADTEKRIIGAAHAGWKGAIAGVLEATIAAMRALGASDIVATIGPAIAQDSYEVGAEFYERFLQESAVNAQFFLSSSGSTRGSINNKMDPPIKSEDDKRYLFNLPAYGQMRLTRAGIAQCNILPYDTCSRENEFFSYRRATLCSESVYGRQVAAIILCEP